MISDESFWLEMERVVNSHSIIVDRPRGAPHPRYPNSIYPLDYGYLSQTTAGDASGIDIWMGSLGSKILTGVLFTFDTIKNDAEVKLLLGCTKDDIQRIREFNREMKTLFVQNPTVRI